MFDLFCLSILTLSRFSPVLEHRELIVFVGIFEAELGHFYFLVGIEIEGKDVRGVGEQDTNVFNEERNKILTIFFL